MEDCYIIFEDGREPYKFSLDKMAVAIKFSHEQNWPVLAIKTPYYYLSLIDEDSFNAVMEGTKVKLPSEDQAADV